MLNQKKNSVKNRKMANMLDDISKMGKTQAISPVDLNQCLGNWFRATSTAGSDERVKNILQQNDADNKHFPVNFPSIPKKKP